MTARGCAVIGALVSFCLPALGQTTGPEAPRGEVGKEAPDAVAPRPSPKGPDTTTGGSPAQLHQDKAASPAPVEDPRPAQPSAAPKAPPVVGPLPILVPPLPGVQMPSPPGPPSTPLRLDQQEQKEPGWYNGGSYSFNLLNIEYYDLNTKDIHFSGQRRDIDNEWAGLAALLARSKGMGFVEIDRKFINLRNLSSIHDLGGSRGATLTFRDGATLKITRSEMGRLVEITK